MITFFKNIHEIDQPFYREIDVALNRIKSGESRKVVDAVRREPDKSLRDKLKRKLPAVCFSGRFRSRKDSEIIDHSGFICLDFDGFSSWDELMEHREDLASLDYTYALFVSPSGNGLKMIVKIPKDPENHTRYFAALDQYIGSEYFDSTSKNISRVCYESYDPEIYINKDSLLWDQMSDVGISEVSQEQIHLPVTDRGKTVERLIRWWEGKYPMVSGQRNSNLFVLMKAFNDHGVDKADARAVAMKYISSDFREREVSNVVDSAYSDTSSFGSRTLNDDQTIQMVERGVSRGMSRKAILDSIPEADEDMVMSVIKQVEQAKKKFWIKNKNGTISMVHWIFKDFLEGNGFFKYAPHNSTKFVFVKVTDNLIDRVSEELVKDFILDYVESFEEMDVYNYFLDKTRYFKSDFLSMLKTVNVHFVADSMDHSFIYFRNVAVKVTKKEITKVDYLDLDGYVWRDQVIDRDFDHCDSIECDFVRFISNIAGGDPNRINSLRSTIGYLMSGYKDPGFCPAVILNDEVITDNPEGGTGKGLFVQGIGQMKKVDYINGKEFNFDSQFSYQTINTDTQIISFDDVKKGFNFERLFSVITEGISIEKKNMDAIRVPFESSPKIVITTNYAIRGKGSSFERRKWEIELRQHYTMSHTPIDEFGKRLFDDWDEEEWCSFDNYMLGNLQYYLNNGLVQSDFKNLAIRKLASETCHEFIEWCGLIEGSKPSDELKMNRRVFKDRLYTDFIQDNPDFQPKSKMTISRRQFYRWLISFGSFKRGVEIEEGRDSAGRWIMFKDENYDKISKKGETEIPF